MANHKATQFKHSTVVEYWWPLVRHLLACVEQRDAKSEGVTWSQTSHFVVALFQWPDHNLGAQY
jgi:hypothetical protein